MMWSLQKHAVKWYMINCDTQEYWSIQLEKRASNTRETPCGMNELSQLVWQTYRHRISTPKIFTT